jgi:hypothetical protein
MFIPQPVHRRAAASLLDRHLIDVAPQPSLAALERPDQRMPGRAEVRRRMPVARSIAAADVPARLALPQVHPHIAERKALLTAVAGWMVVADLIEVRAGRWHDPQPAYATAHQPCAPAARTCISKYATLNSVLTVPG